MSVSAPTIVAKRQAEMSREEWDARVQLAACYRIFDYARLDRDDLQPHHAARARPASGISSSIPMASGTAR